MNGHLIITGSSGGSLLGEKGAFHHSQETNIPQLRFTQRCSSSQVPNHSLLNTWHQCSEKTPREGAHKANVHKPKCTHHHGQQAVRRGGVRKAWFRHSPALSLGLDLAGAQSPPLWTAFDPPLLWKCMGIPFLLRLVFIDVCMSM